MHPDERHDNASVGHAVSRDFIVSKILLFIFLILFRLFCILLLFLSNLEDLIFL